MFSISNNKTSQRRRSIVTALLPSMLGVALLAGCDSRDGNEDLRAEEDRNSASDCYPCVSEGACDDCTPGPTGLCPEHIDAAIDLIGGEHMQAYRDDIIDHIHNGTVPHEDWAGHDVDLHLIQEFQSQSQSTQAQSARNAGELSCFDASVDLGTELLLDTAAVLSDFFFFSGYFNPEMKTAARSAAREVSHDLVHETETVKLFVAGSEEATEASRIARMSEVTFSLLGANGFSHVLFEGMKKRYDLHHWLGRWHLASDILVGTATVATVVVPQSWPVWVVKLTGYFRALADVINWGVDLTINVENVKEACN